MLQKRRVTVNTTKNFWTYFKLKEQGWDYIINPSTGELHDIQRGSFYSSHNLTNANLERFYPVVDVGEISIRDIRDGEEIEILDINTGKAIGTYTLNKCKHCF